MVILFAVSAVVLWTAPALPIPAGGGTWAWTWRVGLLVLLLVPAAITQLFGLGLGQLASVPPQLLEQGLESAGHAADVLRGVSDKEARWSGRLTGLLRGLYRVGRSSLNVRDTALGGFAMVKLFNPLVIVSVVAAVLAGLVVTAAAALSVLLRLLI